MIQAHLWGGPKDGLVQDVNYDSRVLHYYEPPPAPIAPSEPDMYMPELAGYRYTFDGWLDANHNAARYVFSWGEPFPV